MKVAVIGSGVAGLGAAWALSRLHDVTVLEASDYAGGHANTREVEVEGRPLAVDTGFIVFNRRNYPLLSRLLAHLGVAHRASDMSFSVSLDDGAYEYEGSPTGLFAQRSNLVRPAHWRMLREILRFYRNAPRTLDEDRGEGLTLGDLLDDLGMSPEFAERHILPMGAAIWSASPSDMRAFPARRFVRFFANHGLFDLAGRPRWRTVQGGSRSYVRELVRALPNGVRLSCPVQALRRTAAGVEVHDGTGRVELYDQVVLATHADQAVRILGDAGTPRERSVLGGFGYSANRAVLHIDPSLMPRRRSAWASWNYLSSRQGGAGEGRVCVSYWMNRLQGLQVRTPVIVTLNPVREPDARHVLFETTYSHPQFDVAADRAQSDLATIQGADRVWFCGSYCGDGFHEDALSAGLAVAKALGAPAPWAAVSDATGAESSRGPAMVPAISRASG